MNKREHTCAMRTLCADKAMPIWRDLIYGDPSLVLESRLGGIQCQFTSGEALFIPECRWCAWEDICTVEEKIKCHHS